MKDVKDPKEIRLPGSDCIFVVLRVEVTKEDVSFAQLLNALLDRVHGPEIES